MKKHISFLLALIMVLALVPVQAEAATKLTQYVKVETAKTSGASAGTIRYVNQMPGGTYFYDSYWGDNRSVASIQCNLASISMALSYTGINKLPARMTPFSSPSTIISGTGASVQTPTSVSKGIDRMQSGNGKYSPVVIRMTPYNTPYYSGEHWVVVADRISDNTYYIIDPSYGNGGSAYYRATISGNTLTAWGLKSHISDRYQFYNPSGYIKPILSMKFKVNGGEISSSTYGMDRYGTIQKDGVAFMAKWPYGYGHENGLPNAATLGMSRAGYVFKGWSLSEDGSTRIFGEDEQVKAQDIYPDLKNGNKAVTLYAIWEAKPAQITYKPESLTMHPGESAKVSASVFGVNVKTVALDSDKSIVTAQKGTLNWTPSSGKSGTFTVTVNAVSLGKGTVELCLKNAAGQALARKSLTVNVVRLDEPKVTAKTKADTGKPRLTWAAVDGATGYEIYRALKEDGSYTKLYTTTKSYFTNVSAEVGTKYYYRVKAVSYKSVAATSAYSTAKGITCDCARPVVSVTTVAKTGKPRLTWDVVPGASGYEVYRAFSKNGTYTKMYTTTATCYTNTSAVAGTKYYYKVKALSSKGSASNSAYSAVKAITCDCARPVVSITTTATTGKPKLTWNAVTGAASYEVYRATGADGTYTKVFTTANNSYTNTSAKAGAKYYYKVKAVSSKSEAATSAYSNVVSIRAK